MLNLRRQNGFTLVELMVVVAIIGILSSVAIPQFQTYQAKSRTSEAKLALAAIYSAEIAFQGETDFFATCLPAMGYRPASFGNAAWGSGAVNRDQRYYTVGFNTHSNTVPNGLASGVCIQTQMGYLGTKGGNASTLTNLTLAVVPTIASSSSTTTTVSSPTLFTAQALGSVDSGNLSTSATTGDSWTIDQNKSLLHTRNGY